MSEPEDIREVGRQFREAIQDPIAGYPQNGLSQDFLMPVEVTLSIDDTTLNSLTVMAVVIAAGLIFGRKR